MTPVCSLTATVLSLSRLDVGSGRSRPPTSRAPASAARSPSAQPTTNADYVKDPTDLTTGLINDLATCNTILLGRKVELPLKGAHRVGRFPCRLLIWVPA